MRNVVYCAPFLSIPTTHRFATALRSLERVRLLGVCQQPPPPQVAGLYDHVEVVPDALDAGQLFDGVERLRRRFGPPLRILGILEDLQIQLAQLRAHYQLPGGDVEAARRFRDKGQMKEALAAAGLPCARYRRLRSGDEAWAAAAQLGFPLILKPPAGAGARATFEVRDPEALAEALRLAPPSAAHEVLAEEFIEGREHSLETLCIHGEPVFHSIGRYLPGPLEVSRTPWIQWVCLLPRDISGPQLDDARQIGFAAVRRLGMDSGMTHMEWFRRADGSVAIGEIAMRPPGAQFVSLMSHAHDADLYRAWARAVVDGAFDGPHERRYAAAIAYLRGAGPGERVASVEGLQHAQDRWGSLVVEARLPQRGMPRGSGYEGDGFVILKHPDTDVVLQAARGVISSVQVRYA